MVEQAVVVHAFGRRVGVLALEPAADHATFTYDGSWVNTGLELSPVMMRADSLAAYAFPDLEPSTFHGLPGLFADVLADALADGARFGTSEDPRVGCEGQLGAASALDLLVVIGDRGTGALSFGRPGDGPTTSGSERSPLQPATAPNRVTSSEGSWEDAIRFAYQRLAVAAGIRTPQMQWVDGEQRHHLWIHRIDRAADGSPRHVQSLCALAHLDPCRAGVHDYERCFEVSDRLGLGLAAKLQIFRRMVFNVAAVNRADDTRSIRFLMDAQGRWELAPAHDLTFAPGSDSDRPSSHGMSIAGRSDDVSSRDLLDLAGRLDLPGAESVVDEVVTAVTGWTVVATDLGIEEEVVGRIRRLHERYAPR